MAASNKAIFATVLKQASASVTSPDTSFTGPTNVATLYTASGTGARVERVRCVFAASTSGAGLLNLWLHDGTNYRLLRSVVYALVTASTTVPPALADGSGTFFFEGGLLLPSGYSIRASYTVGTGSPPLHCTADIGEYA